MSRATAESVLRRIEEQIKVLDALPESHARETARGALEAVLDLHGLALARLAAVVAMSGKGEDLFAAFAADDQVAAVLLLHGLHPEMPELRVRRALHGLAPVLRAQGAELHLIHVRDGVARLNLRLPGGSREQMAMLRHDIEEAIIEAAPDLDEVAILNEVAHAPEDAAAS